MADAVTDAGIHPAFAHAVRVTGFIVTEMNAEQFTDDDIQEWNTALAAGEAIYGPIEKGGQD